MEILQEKLETRIADIEAVISNHEQAASKQKWYDPRKYGNIFAAALLEMDIYFGIKKKNYEGDDFI